MASTPNGALLHVDGNQPLLSLIVKMPAAATVELAGHAGFDFVMIDTEHGSNDMNELEHHIRAADSAGIRTLVRVSDVWSADILRALDAGANGIVVPHVARPEDVLRAAALTRYPPDGRRSLATSTRAGRHGMLTIAEHLDTAGRRVALIAQLEDADALTHIPEILAVDGLAGIFIGPTDLSASLGWPGQLDHPTVTEAIEQIAEAVLERPDLALCALAANEYEAQGWIERGARMILLNAPSLMAERLTAISASVKPTEPRETTPT